MTEALNDIPMNNQPIPRHQLVQQLLALGAQAGDVLLVHTSFRAVRPVDGGPEVLIDALRDAVSPDGTLVMPAMSDDDDHPFDPNATPCRGMGIVADTFWRLPGVLRSDSPHSFAAAGAHAARITAPHPIDVPHGLDSPVGRVWELDGQVLLLGVGHDSDTMIHLAENLAGVRYRRQKYLTVLENGRPTRFDYAEIDHCTEKFALLDGWLEEKGSQRTGTVAHATARLARSRDIVGAVVGRLQKEETVFLHPKGIDIECDEARDSLIGLGPYSGTARVSSLESQVHQQ
jgi:aminoglycoside 3-N-acetyltransferase